MTDCQQRRFKDGVNGPPAIEEWKLPIERDKKDERSVPRERVSTESGPYQSCRHERKEYRNSGKIHGYTIWRRSDFLLETLAHQLILSIR
jgi:hypothetical protein